MEVGKRRRSSSTTHRAPLGAVAVFTAGACGGDPDASAASTPSTAREEGSGHGAPSDVPEGARHIAVEAESFAFKPSEIEVTAGEPATIVLSPLGAEHDFVVDEFEMHVSPSTGGTDIDGVFAPEPGRYVLCCRVAGLRDGGMEGNLVAGAAS